MTTTDDKPRCRSCGRVVRPTVNGDAGTHDAGYGVRCPGSRRPLEGDPPCNDACHGYGHARVSYPADLNPEHRGPSASTDVCFNPKHMDEAVTWVREITGQPGTYVPRKRRGES